MAFSDLGNVLGVFADLSANDEVQDELFKEALLKTLAQASNADANMHSLEVKMIKEIMQREIGEEVTETEIREASRSDLFGSASLRKYLRRISGKLNTRNKAAILRATVDVIRSDSVVNVLEIDYFNNVADALSISPAEQYGLTA